ncbi:hypothetical protein J3A83DRAFT_1161623 [Scleroderma citrinum]
MVISRHLVHTLPQFAPFLYGAPPRHSGHWQHLPWHSIYDGAINNACECSLGSITSERSPNSCETYGSLRRSPEPVRDTYPMPCFIRWSHYNTGIVIRSTMLWETRIPIPRTTDVTFTDHANAPICTVDVARCRSAVISCPGTFNSTELWNCHAKNLFLVSGQSVERQFRGTISSATFVKNTSSTCVSNSTMQRKVFKNQKTLSGAQFNDVSVISPFVYHIIIHYIADSSVAPITPVRLYPRFAVIHTIRLCTCLHCYPSSDVVLTYHYSSPTFLGSPSLTFKVVICIFF